MEATLLFRMTIFLVVLVANVGSSHADELLFRIRDQNKPSFDFSVTRSIIDKLPAVQFETILPGDDNKPHLVRGPLLRDILKLSGATGDVINAIAIDKYEVEIPVSDLTKYDVIAAIEIDGNQLNLRTRGPVWIVYPVSGTPELLGDTVIEARMIWQLSEMVLK